MSVNIFDRNMQRNDKMFILLLKPLDMNNKNIISYNSS